MSQLLLMFSCSWEAVAVSQHSHWLARQRKKKTNQSQLVSSLSESAPEWFGDVGRWGRKRKGVSNKEMNKERRGEEKNGRPVEAWFMKESINWRSCVNEMWRSWDVINDWPRVCADTNKLFLVTAPVHGKQPTCSQFLSRFLHFKPLTTHFYLKSSSTCTAKLYEVKANQLIHWWKKCSQIFFLTNMKKNGSTLLPTHIKASNRIGTPGRVKCRSTTKYGTWKN